jgi:hypothetical protein
MPGQSATELTPFLMKNHDCRLNYLCSAEGRFALSTSPVRLEAWFQEELPRLNVAVLSGAAPCTAVADGLVPVLPDLPAPAALSVHQAQRLIIGLGLAGASVARHYQERDQSRKQAPERAFDGLLSGPQLVPFRSYFAELSDYTGTGHYARDTYASLVLWNVPTTEVRYNGQSLASLPGVTDNEILSYTGDPSERWFFELVKRGQTLEAAANSMLEPLAEGPDSALVSAEGLARVQVAVALLEALRQLFLEFADATREDGMQPAYFMDVFRQFAAHWVAGDIPPSGALDADALKRDFLLGTVDEQYVRHVDRMMPALLAAERTAVGRRMGERSLPDRLLAMSGLDRDTVEGLSPDQLRALTIANPSLEAWHRLLSSHARSSGAHLMLSKRFLFNPQRRRDEEGIGDRTLVSNRRGTTGMDESMLDRLTRMRREHSLAGFRRAPATASHSMANVDVGAVELLPARPLADAALAASGAGGRPIGRRSRLASPRTGEQVTGG